MDVGFGCEREMCGTEKHVVNPGEGMMWRGVEGVISVFWVGQSPYICELEDLHKGCKSGTLWEGLIWGVY